MFDKIFDAVSNSVSRFALGWAIPSAVSVGFFAIFIFPQVDRRGPFAPIRTAVSSGGSTLVAVIGLFVLAVSTLFAYLQVPIYRLLEGYTLPEPLRNWCYRGELRRWLVLQRTADRPGQKEIRRQLRIEEQMLYPERREQLQATRLGNALRAMEDYGTVRYSLDTQTLWYELLNTAPTSVRRDSEQARASVDFFVSSMAHLTLLGLASVAAAFIAVDPLQCVVVAVLSFLLVRPAYQRPVHNVLEWRFTTQALVNLGRPGLAKGLGFRWPKTYWDEQNLWYRTTSFVLRGDRTLWEESEGLDDYRLVTSDGDGSSQGLTESEVGAGDDT